MITFVGSALRLHNGDRILAWRGTHAGATMIELNDEWIAVSEVRRDSDGTLLFTADPGHRRTYTARPGANLYRIQRRDPGHPSSCECHSKGVGR